MVPLGLRMARGVAAGIRLMTGVATEQNVAVEPVSAMAEKKHVEAGGPSVGESKGIFWLLGTLFKDSSVCSTGGFPPSYSLFVGRRGGPRMRLLPPFMLPAVAVQSCPSFLFWQVALVWSAFFVSPCDQQ